MEDNGLINPLACGVAPGAFFYGVLHGLPLCRRTPWNFSYFQRPAGLSVINGPYHIALEGALSLSHGPFLKG